VLDAAGQRDIYTTEGAVRWGAGAVEHFEIEIPRGVVALDEEAAPPKGGREEAADEGRRREDER
jgi:hypothetical protein